MARRGPTIGHRPMHRTLPETSPVVLALVRGLNPPVTPALASSAPAAGPIFYHFRATERHLLPTHQPLAAPATLRDGPCFCGLLSWICVRIDEYPLAATSFSKRHRAPGAWSDCTREWRVARQDFGRSGAWLRCADLDHMIHAAPKPWAGMVYHSTGSPRQTPG